MLWDKGIGEFIDACKIIKGKNINARFVLVGESDPDNPAAIDSKQLDTWQSSCFVDWLGRQEEISSIFALSHIVCLPSYREGLPKVLLEAAACGRPIVTTNTPGCREIVRHGENGLLVPVKDSKALAQALECLIFDAELRKKMGARGREIAVQEFSVEKVVRETLAIYKELLGP